MRRLIEILFFLWAFSALMLAWQSARADDIPKPVAVCVEGVCEMAEADYLKLREFIAAAQRAVERNEANIVEVNQLLAELRGKVERCAADKHKNVSFTDR